MSESEQPAKRQPRPVFRDLTPEESARLAAARKESQAEASQFLQRAERLEAALQETTVSGQLRQAIVASGLQYVDLARCGEISVQELADFMVGEAELNSTAFDRLAEALGCRLVVENA